jgi:hypothetical protein
VLPVALTPDVSLLPSAGISLLGVAGADGGTAFGGVNAGLATVLWTGKVGIRTGVTLHHLLNQRGAIWLVELGLVHAS